ncbi:hypothetical protein ES708_07857 [subsurface metagenome]
MLARIFITLDDLEKIYIFQLAAKNLREKGEIFYKPIGGHIKYIKDTYQDLINKFKIRLNKKNEQQDFRDISFYIIPKYFNSFISTFKKDILNKTFYYFENPKISILREIKEEIGPVDTNDGISLLNHKNIYQEIFK